VYRKGANRRGGLSNIRLYWVPVSNLKITWERPEVKFLRGVSAISVSEPIAIARSHSSIPIRSRTETRKCKIGAIGNKEAFADPASWASVGPQFNEARSLQIWQMNSLFGSVVGVVGEGSVSAEFANKCRPDVGIGI
jgi:hypothetical protein